MTIHSIEPDESSLHFDFSRQREPVLSIAPGDVVRVRTLDSGGYLEPRRVDDAPVQRVHRPTQGHALCGPIAISGARPGQTLEVDLREIRCGTWGWTVGGNWQTDLNERLRVADEPGSLLIWSLDPDGASGVDQFGHRVALHPFMGVLGMPPDEAGGHSTTPPRVCGGNLDCKELVAGTRLYLPISVPDALFSIGDGHALQGDGEVSGTAIECPMERVEVKLTVLDEPTITMPRAWTPDAWITLGLHEDLREATAIAIDEMLGLMQELHGLSRSRAITLASLVVDVRVTQLVNQVVGAHAVLPHDAF